MLYPRSKGCSIAMVVLLSGLLSTATKAQTESDFKKQAPEITEAITKIGTGTTPEARAEAAEHVADLTSGIISTWVDDKAFAELVSFLDTPEDPAQFWVAVSLGNLEYRARTAIPKLQELLPKADCLQGDLTVADAIRYALARMQAVAPPPTCGRAEAKELLFKKLLTKTITLIRKDETHAFQIEAGYHLASLEGWIDPDKVDDQSISELISLLDPSTYMPVRDSVIGALGSLGTRAKAAIPALQEILAEENCVTEPSMAVSVEDDARSALRQMGIAHPPSRCGRPYMN